MISDLTLCGTLLVNAGAVLNFRLKKTDEECNIKETSYEKGVHVCTNFASKHYWMYTHSTRISCTLFFFYKNQ